MHLVWIPKYRNKVLARDFEVKVRDILRKISNKNDIVILSGKIAKDHIDMVVSYRSHQSISRIVQKLKEASSRIIM